MPYTDIRKNTFIERLPQKWRAFFYLIRFDRPIGIWLLLLPSLWSITLALFVGLEKDARFGFVHLKTSIFFIIGAFVMRSAGCIINDLWDRDLDKKVERTAQRPLASGEISPRQAFALLGCLLLVGLVVLLSFNLTTIILGVIALGFVIAYPLMKRITWWPQAFLGLTFNFGALMGWSAITGSLDWPAYLLYIAAVFWTLGYDTIYAYQDIEDDALAGIKSTARLFGKKSWAWVTAFYTLCFWCLMAVVFFSTTNSLSVLVVMPCGLLLVHQLYNWDPEQPKSALKMFKANKNFGLLFLLALLFI